MIPFKAKEYNRHHYLSRRCKGESDEAYAARVRQVNIDRKKTSLFAGPMPSPVRLARALENTHCCGYWFARWQQEHGLSEDELAQWLGLSGDLWVRLSACARPEPDDDYFGEDIEVLAQLLGCDAQRLGDVLGRLNLLDAAAYVAFEAEFAQAWREELQRDMAYETYYTTMLASLKTTLKEIRNHERLCARFITYSEGEITRCGRSSPIPIEVSD